jgi:formyltetrahydrofolate synthetase
LCCALCCKTVWLEAATQQPHLAGPQDKIEAIARSYGAAGVSYSPEAEAQIAKYTAMGFDKLPICMAKTQYSFSHDAKLKGEGNDAWVVLVRACVR